MDKKTNILKAIAFISALFTNLTNAEESTSSFFIGEAKNDEVSSITQPLNSHVNEVSMLFDFGNKSKNQQPCFSIILFDYEKTHFVSIKFIKNKEGATGAEIKGLGQRIPLSNLGISKRLSVTLSELKTNQLGITIKGQSSEYQVIELPFNVEQIKFWAKGGELNMYYLIMR